MPSLQSVRPAIERLPHFLVRREEPAVDSKRLRFAEAQPLLDQRPQQTVNIIQLDRRGTLTGRTGLQEGWR